MEVLSEIYGDCIEQKPEGRFVMRFLPYIGDERDKAFVFVRLEFTLSKDYPQAPPVYKLLEHKGLDEDGLQKFKAMIKQR